MTPVKSRGLPKAEEIKGEERKDQKGNLEQEKEGFQKKTEKQKGTVECKNRA